MTDKNKRHRDAVADDMLSGLGIPKKEEKKTKTYGGSTYGGSPYGYGGYDYGRDIDDFEDYYRHRRTRFDDLDEPLPRQTKPLGSSPVHDYVHGRRKTTIEEDFYGKESPRREQPAGAMDVSKQTAGVQTRLGQYNVVTGDYNPPTDGFIRLDRLTAAKLVKIMHGGLADFLEANGIFWKSGGALDLKAALTVLIEENELMLRHDGALHTVALEESPEAEAPENAE